MTKAPADVCLDSHIAHNLCSSHGEQEDIEFGTIKGEMRKLYPVLMKVLA